MDDLIPLKVQLEQQIQDELFELKEIFERQLTTVSYINSYEVTIDNNKMYLSVNTSVSNNRFFDEYVKSFALGLSLHINRRLIYKDYKSILCGTKMIFLILEDNFINPSIPTLKAPIVFQRQTERDNYYTEDIIIVNVIKSLNYGVEIPHFRLDNNMLLYKDKPVVLINELKDVIKKCDRSGSMRDYDAYYYHMYMLENIKYPLEKLYEYITKSYNISHKSSLSYGYVTKENRNWILTDFEGTKTHFYGDWNKDMLDIIDESKNVERRLMSWESFLRGDDVC